MLCKRPIAVGEARNRVGCGRCLPCTINKRRAWTARMLLEGWDKPCSFVTMTYDEKRVPYNADGHMTLAPDDLRAWLKDAWDVASFRFFAVGEYGDRTHRPHFHAILFGLDPLQAEQLLEETWKDGLTHVGEFNEKSAAYCARYVTKKLTGARNANNPHLNGRYPEFARMSRNPGIGADAADRIADTMRTMYGSTSLLEFENGDAPFQFRHQGRKWPLDRYMVNRIRKRLNLPLTRKEGAPGRPGRREDVEAQRWEEKAAVARAERRLSEADARKAQRRL